MNKDLIGSVFNAVLKLNISQVSPVNKCLPLTKIAYILAKASDDKEMIKIFERELTGYDDGKVPEYRYIDESPVKLSLGKIVDIFNKEENNFNAHAKIGGRVVRLRKLISMLQAYDIYVYKYISRIVQQSEKSSVSIPEISLPKDMPDDLKEIMGEMEE